MRDYNISKKEWVLDGEPVMYDDFHTVPQSIAYDIEKEQRFNYALPDERAAAEHIAQFVSGLWQVHAFGEGNTRAIAVFTIQYLRSLGYEVTNDTFEKNAYYFRNALVRANYNNRKNGVTATPLYLNRFFGNLLLGEHHALKSREMRIKI